MKSKFYINTNNQHYLKNIDKDILLDLDTGEMIYLIDRRVLTPVPRTSLSLADLSAHIEKYEVLTTQKIIEECCVHIGVLSCSPN